MLKRWSRRVWVCVATRTLQILGLPGEAAFVKRVFEEACVVVDQQGAR